MDGGAWETCALCKGLQGSQWSCKTMNRVSTGQERSKSYLSTEKMMGDRLPWSGVCSHRLNGLDRDRLKWGIPVYTNGPLTHTSLLDKSQSEGRAMTTIAEVTMKSIGPTTVAYLPVTGSFTLIPESFVRLYQWISSKGYTPSGPPSGVFYSNPDQVPEEQLSWELRGPLADSTPTSEPDEDGVGVKRLGAMLVAATMHRGPYEEIENSFYEALAKWITDNGYEIIGPSEEAYFSDPNTPPEDILTEVRVPVRRR